MFSRGVETLRIDGYLTLTLSTHGNLAAFRRLMKYVDPMSMARAHPNIEAYSYKLRPLDAKSTLGRGKGKPGEQGACQRSEWGHASSDGLMLGDAIGYPRNGERTGRSRDVRLWTGSDLRFPRSHDNSVPTLSCTC